MAKQVPKKKGANGYKFPEHLPNGEILTDLAKKCWKLGPTIGQGGFGEIYAAQDANLKSSKYPHVVKIEPHENGPLFVEINFYIRNAKNADVEQFKAAHKLKSLGMPTYVGSGSHEYKNEKYRFLVMDKFGNDVWSIFLENNRAFPLVTVFKLALQTLDILEYIHSRGYVHADIKGANMLLGAEKDLHQIYLVDFGLATKFTTDSVFKPNPKKAHDGTIEYLSRDAHNGVQTRRGDLEILAYNMIQWLGCTLPWEKNLKDAKTVQEFKEKSMANVLKFVKDCFGSNRPPAELIEFLHYINKLEFNEEPNYKKIRSILKSTLDSNGKINNLLIFTKDPKSPGKRKALQSATGRKKSKNDDEIDITEEKMLTKKNTTKKKSDVSNGIKSVDPFEGYTPEMRAIALKKLEKSKPKKGSGEKTTSTVTGTRVTRSTQKM